MYKALKVGVLALFAGCAAPSIPYVRTQIVGDYQLNWFSDGPNIGITVYNPTNETQTITVFCHGDDGPVGPWVTRLGPHSEFHAFGQVMNRYAPFDPCWVAK